MSAIVKTEREKKEDAFGFLRDFDINNQPEKIRSLAKELDDIDNNNSDEMDNDCFKKTIFTHLTLTPGFVILSALTGTAILSAYFNGYNLTESTTMAAIGGPFAIMLEMCFIPCTMITIGRSEGSPSACSIWWNSIFATVIGHGIYNGYKESEITIGQITAASSLGSSILAIPYMCTIGYYASHMFTSQKANHGQESLRINTNPNAIEEESSPSEPTRQAIARV